MEQLQDRVQAFPSAQVIKRYFQPFRNRHITVEQPLVTVQPTVSNSSPKCVTVTVGAVVMLMTVGLVCLQSLSAQAHTRVQAAVH
jgi:hypothetical protein